MVVQPKIRGFICTTSHPEGCAVSVAKQVEYIRSRQVDAKPINALIIGASTGYGLASRIALSFGAKASTIGVFFEKPSVKNRTATAGWYNTAAFEQLAHAEGCYAKSINGDAFSHDIKNQTIDLIAADLGKIDLLVYSLASPRRVHPDTGQVFASTLKPLDDIYTSKTLNTMTKEVCDISLAPASGEDVANTVAVMGGEDWQMWVDCLKQADLLAEGFNTVAYTYVGPELTHPIYKNGTIGLAKTHLYQTAEQLQAMLTPINGRALISVNKALVTQASSAIPVVPLYMSMLFKLMQAKGTHEGCIEQMYRLFFDYIYSSQPLSLDTKGHIRLDDLEMDPDIQQSINEMWAQVNSDNLDQLADVDEYINQFHHLFGFGWDEVDYELDVDLQVDIPSITTEDAV